MPYQDEERALRIPCGLRQLAQAITGSGRAIAAPAVPDLLAGRIGYVPWSVSPPAGTGSELFRVRGE